MQPAKRGRSDDVWAFNTCQTAYTNAMGLLLALVKQVLFSTPTNGGGGNGSYIARSPLMHLVGADRVD